MDTLANEHFKSRKAVVMDCGRSPCGLPRNDEARWPGESDAIARLRRMHYALSGWGWGPPITAARLMTPARRFASVGGCPNSSAISNWFARRALRER